MTVSFIEQTIAGQLSYKAGEVAGSMISRTPLPDSPFTTKKAPTPSGFKQTPLPTYTRQFTEEPSKTDVRPVGEGGEGQTGTKYSISGKAKRGTGYDYSLDVEPILTGPQPRQRTVDPEEPDFGASYIDYVVGQNFGSKKYYDAVTGQIKYGMPGAIKNIMSPTMGLFAGAGAAISQANLERIAKNAFVGKDGFAVATLAGRTIGVSPGPVKGSYVLSGVLPEEITSTQRKQIIDKLLEISKTDAASGAYTPEGTGTPQSGSDPSDPAFAGDGQYYSGVGPSPQEGGSAGDPGYISTPPSDYQREPGGGGHPSGTPNDPSPEPSPSPSRSEPSGPSGYGRDSSGNQRSDPSGYGGFGGRRASGGPVGFAEGGNTQKDPIQRTGFVEGPPQEYAKGTTVADTENLRVREGSFVINAPMTEKLQKAGVLPKGNQKRKAANGGKMMEVALSKGEYVVEPKDVPKFGGYSFLEAVNDMGKPEVERRQAAAE